MNTALPLMLCAGLAVSGCARIANSSFNPMNWFAASTAAAQATPGGELRSLVTGGIQLVDARPLVSNVTALQVDRTPGGAIVVASGQVPSQGWYNAELVRAGLSNGVLTFAFRAEQPQRAMPVGTPATRTITAATALDAADLAGVSTIRVEGQGNVRTAAR